MLYDNATVTSYFTDGGSDTQDCEVRMDGETIVVDGGDWMYEGREQGPGHYRLESRGRNGNLDGTATLHRFDGASRLVGDWVEGRESGTWRIDLGA